MTQPTAAMLIIGDEILSGRTREGNLPVLAARLSAMGVRLAEARVVADDREAIIAAVRALSGAWDHVFTSGGIGPTHDDITADCVAEAFGRTIDIREDARAILTDYYGENLTPARLRMARIPAGARLIHNPVSRAPGFSIGNVHVMAGVPDIFEAMLDDALAGIKGGPAMRAVSLTAATPESGAAEGLRAIDAAYEGVTLGSYPFHRGGMGVTVVLRAIDEAALEQAAEEVTALLTRLSGEPPRREEGAARA